MSQNCAQLKSGKLLLKQAIQNKIQQAISEMQIDRTGLGDMRWMKGFNSKIAEVRSSKIVDNVCQESSKQNEKIFTQRLCDSQFKDSGQSDTVVLKVV